MLSNKEVTKRLMQGLATHVPAKHVEGLTKVQYEHDFPNSLTLYFRTGEIFVLTIRRLE